jgi:glycine cleavage system H protein
VYKRQSLINADPYGAGWIAKLRPTDWDADAADLATGASGVEAYGVFLDDAGISCGD